MRRQVGFVFSELRRLVYSQGETEDKWESESGHLELADEHELASASGW